MKKQTALLLTDAVINVFGFIAVTALFPGLLLFTPLINLAAVIVILCMGAALLYAVVLSKMAQKAMAKCEIGFWRYTLFSVLPAVIAPLGISSFCLIEWLNRPPVSYKLDLFLAVCALTSVIVLFSAYLLLHKLRKHRTINSSSPE